MKIYTFCLLLIGVLATATNAEDFRTWNVITGGNFEAKLLSVGATKVSLENREGKVIDFPTADLKPSNQKYIRDWSSAQAAASGVAVSDLEHSDFAKKVYKNLVYSKGSRLVRFKPEPSDNPKYFAFYKSALWCPPCRAFTPKLVKFYKDQKQNGAAFELIYISSDRSEDSMAEYMSKYEMPWPAFEFGKNKKIVSTNGGGIPNLIVTDSNGKKLFGSYNNSGKYTGPTAVMKKLEKLLEE